MLNVSSARPQPCCSLMPPPRVYMTVSRSGQTRRPNSVMSSPVLPTTVISASGAASFRPGRKRAAPTPPASTVIRIPKVCQVPARPPDRAVSPSLSPLVTREASDASDTSGADEVRGGRISHVIYLPSQTTRRPLSPPSLDLQQEH